MTNCLMNKKLSLLVMSSKRKRRQTPVRFLVTAPCWLSRSSKNLATMLTIKFNNLYRVSLNQRNKNYRILYCFLRKGWALKRFKNSKNSRRDRESWVTTACRNRYLSASSNSCPRISAKHPWALPLKCTKPLHKSRFKTLLNPNKLHHLCIRICKRWNQPT